jgi:dihydrofolate synthase / folylpolyglutamate synthase
MSYPETLDYLFQHLPMYQRIGPAAYKKDLGNIRALCENLGHPERRFACIHVGGTNGKGSVSHMLAAVCQAAGLKTGLYISPHYKDFRERIKVDGRYIPRKRVVEFTAQNRATIEAIQPSFFELCAAMAFEHFAREKVDIAIIEVGLGGRLDSTNIIDPLLSVITNISYDHMALLGDTLPQIAFEKAGIIKPGVPVVIGETHPESAPVFMETAARNAAPIRFADQNFRAAERPGTDPEKTRCHIYKGRSLFLEQLEVDAAGPYQMRNLATLVQAVDVLQQLPGFQKLLKKKNLPESPGVFMPNALRAGLQNLRALTRFIGRWQIIGQNPTVLCDSAHNEAGLRVVFAKIDAMMAEKPPTAKLHIVTGFVNDKEVDKALSLFPKSARFYFVKADIPRGLDAHVLQEKAGRQQLNGRAYTTVRNGLKAARRAASPEDLVLVVGSVFVVAEVI